MAGGFVAFVLVVSIAFRVSPWPGALVIRLVFDRGAQKTLVALQRAVPVQPVTVLQNQRYAKGSSKETLDVYIPNSAIQAGKTLPVVIWTHGGAWLSGDKKDSAPYYNLLASQGFVVVALNYSLAPEKAYPAQLHQLNDAYIYLQANAARLHINIDKVVLAGDSASSPVKWRLLLLIRLTRRKWVYGQR